MEQRQPITAKGLDVTVAQTHVFADQFGLTPRTTEQGQFPVVAFVDFFACQ
jgi:hypothetical protein